jgi:hypothetical protein
MCWCSSQHTSVATHGHTSNKNINSKKYRPYRASRLSTLGRNRQGPNFEAKASSRQPLEKKSKNSNCRSLSLPPTAASSSAEPAPTHQPPQSRACSATAVATRLLAATTPRLPVIVVRLLILSRLAGLGIHRDSSVRNNPNLLCSLPDVGGLVCGIFEPQAEPSSLSRSLRLGEIWGRCGLLASCWCGKIIRGVHGYWLRVLLDCAPHPSSVARKMNEDWSWSGWRISRFHFHCECAVFFEFLGGFEWGFGVSPCFQGRCCSDDVCQVVINFTGLFLVLFLWMVNRNLCFFKRINIILLFRCCLVHER